MTLMGDRIAALWPEIALFVAMCATMVMGTSRDPDVRRITNWIAGLGLLLAFVFAMAAGPIEGALLPRLASFVRPMACAVGGMMLLGLGSIDWLYERQVDRGEKRFDPLETSQGEFLCFFLLSLIGLMLTSTAGDLIWLFLALELTSLPTYVMVASGRSKIAAQEAAVKYFFLGALAAAMFLYGFALLYGATGSMHLLDIRAAIEAQATSPEGLSTLAILGLALATIGIAYKIAAVPMHFYTADVYEGAAVPVTAFLAFVPKTAGFTALMLLLATVIGLGEEGRTWPEALRVVLWVMAALTMTVGNTLAILQTRIKRVLAYSSIAHSGYMLVGLLAGTQWARAEGGGDGVGVLGAAAGDGFAAVLFYLLSYGVMNLGAFLVLACLQRRGDDLETWDDLAGLKTRYPGMATVLAVCSLSLLGLPPLIGFFGKIFLVTSGIAAGEYALVVILGLNSAAAAWYYLRLAGVSWLARPQAGTIEQVEPAPAALGRRAAAWLSAAGVVVLVLFTSRLIEAGHRATRVGEAEGVAAVSDDTTVATSDH